jgi:hypothetical protein
LAAQNELGMNLVRMPTMMRKIVCDLSSEERDGLTTDYEHAEPSWERTFYA